MKTAVRDQNGTPLDAHFEILDGAIIFYSRGGTMGASNARNTQYADGLRLILDRLAVASIRINGIWVDSNKVQHLPWSDRLIVTAVEGQQAPTSVFSLASRRMQNVGSATSDATGGNSNKRLKIGLTTQMGEAELTEIISGSTPAAPLRDVLGPDAIKSAEEITREQFGANSVLSGRVWATSFWGFNPEGDGYLGFTRAGDREWFLAQLRRGDLVMIYATSTSATEESIRGKVLGFLEVENRRIRDTDRMSPEGKVWKIANGVKDRWTFAVPVTRAWRVVDLTDARAIAPETLAVNANHQLISSRGALLSPDEAAAALKLRLQPTEVYGQARLDAEEKEKIYIPSRGFPMSFGKRALETIDGAHFLYALQLTGDPSAILDDPPHALRGRMIVKVGLAKDPHERCMQLNSALPPAGRMRWKLILKSHALSDGQNALDAETALKAHFNQKYRSLGGEFFLCEERTLATQFANYGSVAS